MTVKKFGLKTLRREEWRVQLEKLAKENPWYCTPTPVALFQWCAG